MMPTTLPGAPGVLAQDAESNVNVPSDWDWDVAWDMLPNLWDGMWITIQITIWAMLIATTLGLALAMLRQTRLRVVRWPVGFVIEFIRSTPILVQFIFLFYFLPGLGFSVGFARVEFPVLEPMTIAIWGLGIHYATYMSESYRAGILSVPSGQWEASTALNLSTPMTWRTVILPQAIPTVIPALGNYLVAAFKDAPIAVVITVGTVLRAADSELADRARAIEAYTIAGLLFLAVSIPAAMFARYLEKRYGYQRD